GAERGGRGRAREHRPHSGRGGHVTAGTGTVEIRDPYAAGGRRRGERDRPDDPDRTGQGTTHGLRFAARGRDHLGADRTAVQQVVAIVPRGRHGHGHHVDRTHPDPGGT